MSAKRLGRRVLVVGWDGASWDLVQQWMDSGDLPTLRDLYKSGGGGPLRSVLPVLSPSAWASFATGVDPGGHGVFDFVQRTPGSYRLRPVTSLDIQAPSLWQLASQAGKRVVVLNVPLTFPPQPVNGVLVCGLGTPEGQVFTYPRELTRRLKEKGYRVNRTYYFQPGAERRFLDDVYSHTTELLNMAKDFIVREPWDLFVVVFRDCDEITHFFWKHMDTSHPQHAPEDEAFSDTIRAFYRTLDHATKELLEAAGSDTNTLVMSDHGSGPLYRDVYLNEWLRQEGFLSTQDAKSPGPQQVMRSLGLTRAGVSRALQRAGLGRLERLLHHRARGLAAVLPATLRVSFPEVIDWTRTLAYSYGYHGQIYLNVRGREPQGIVDPGAEYLETRNRLAARIREMVDPADGLPVATEVLTVEEAYHGPWLHAAPDLTVVMRNLSYITRHGYEFGSRPGRVFELPATFESGSHRIEGILLCGGPDLERRLGGSGFSILDLAPTILDLLGVPRAEWMEGRTLSGRVGRDADSAQASTKMPIRAASTLGDSGLTPAEEREIMDRLRDLGYLG